MITFIAWGTPIMGGVQNLILNISEELNNKKQKAKIFGYKSCLIYKELIKRKIDFDFYDLELIDSKNLSDYLTNEDVIVFGSYSPRFRLFMFKEANPRILYWNVMADKLTIANKAKFIDLKFRTKKLIKKLDNTNSLVFMDVFGIKSIEEVIGKNLLDENRDSFLPIPVKTYQYRNVFLEREIKTVQEINITYVGRASIWKMQPLKKILIDIANLELKDYKITIHIITQEPEKYKEFIKNVHLHDFIKILYHDNLYGETFQEFLIKNSDLHFAMGTSALDGGVLGIPTIVMDYSMDEFPSNYKYLWLYDTFGYDLGHPVKLENHSKARSMKELVELYCNPDQKSIKQVSERTFQYVHDNHEISNVVDKLLAFASQSQGRVITILNYTLINLRPMKLFLKLIGKDVMKIQE